MTKLMMTNDVIFLIKRIKDKHCMNLNKFNYDLFLLKFCLSFYIDDLSILIL